MTPKQVLEDQLKIQKVKKKKGERPRKREEKREEIKRVAEKERKENEGKQKERKQKERGLMSMREKNYNFMARKVRLRVFCFHTSPLYYSCTRRLS